MVVSDVTEEHLEAKTREVEDLHAKIYQKIKIAQDRQKKAYETRKGRNVKSFHFQIGDEVLKANKRKKGRKGGQLESNWSGPYVVASISEKGVATLSSTTAVHGSTAMQLAEQPATRDEEIDILRRCMIRMAEQLAREPAYGTPTKRLTKMGPDDVIEAQPYHDWSYDPHGSVRSQISHLIRLAELWLAEGDGPLLLDQLVIDRCILSLPPGAKRWVSGLPGSDHHSPQRHRPSDSERGMEMLHLWPEGSPCAPLSRSGGCVYAHGQFVGPERRSLPPYQLLVLRDNRLPEPAGES
ncbi:unnamed protein product [Gadus morhua 'NCC']